jgi:hypothetical protein
MLAPGQLIAVTVPDADVEILAELVWNGPVPSPFNVVPFVSK